VCKTGTELAPLPYATLPGSPSPRQAVFPDGLGSPRTHLVPSDCTSPYPGSTPICSIRPEYARAPPRASPRVRPRTSSRARSRGPSAARSARFRGRVRATAARRRQHG
jgi:hypothetical protein